MTREIRQAGATISTDPVEMKDLGPERALPTVAVRARARDGRRELRAERRAVLAALARLGKSRLS